MKNINVEKIKMIVLDVDGTLTEGRIIRDNTGNSFKNFNAKDGFAISQWIRLGGEVAIITGKDSKIVSDRAEEIGITKLRQGSKNKVKDLQELLEEANLTYENVAYMGDDINDLGILSVVALPAAPNDAVDEVKDIAKFISNKKAGKGAVRELFEYIMKQNGMWGKVISHYMNEAK